MASDLAYWMIGSVVIAFALGVMGLFVWIGVYAEPQGRRMRADLEALIAALRAFKVERGTYPWTLTELVPRYLAALPSGLNERRETKWWKYQGLAPLVYTVLEGGTEFRLIYRKFPANEVYVSQKARWLNDSL